MSEVQMVERVKRRDRGSFFRLGKLEDRIREHQLREHRPSLTNMVEVLLIEALNARDEREREANLREEP